MSCQGIAEEFLNNFNKKILLFFSIVFLWSYLSAQAPQAFQYQSIIRNTAGSVAANRDVSLQIIIRQGTATGTAMYEEWHAVTTNSLGLVNLQIGKGTTTDDFSQIDWSMGPYYLEIGLDLAGGSSYTLMGTTELLSVPYALYAATAGSQGALVDSLTNLVSLLSTEIANNQATLVDSLNGLVLALYAEIETDLVDTLSTLVESFYSETSSQGVRCGLAIGDTYEGGIIFYLDESGCSGLIAAPADQSQGTGMQWYNGTLVATGAERDGIGAGALNTAAIIAAQGAGSHAARLCADYQGGGYGDWYLPSKYELNLMYEHIGQGNTLGLDNISNFTAAIYWSSTEVGQRCCMATVLQFWDPVYEFQGLFQSCSCGSCFLAKR